MRVHYELANFVVSAWKLAQKDERIPTSLGVLDRALEMVIDDLPERFSSALRFAEMPVGRLCVELPDILSCASESYLITEPSYGHDTVGIRISAARAMDLLDDLDIDIAVAATFGRKLATAVHKECYQLRRTASFIR
ncbi:hypothetical protein [Rhizobium sp. BK176]|uniref:hypothetical protein n=1 Tax=Rhizobium sp. BK176 TaxID=2587071 RepID=UPI00216A3310|nr:hypothetical protein [Rhizobium sp. BK176]MCS4088779.1 hypothetical protein [Rhizobium sp. BK176]